MNTFLFWFAHVWILFIYGIVLYRLLAPNAKLHPRENIGLLAISFLMAGSGDLKPAERIAVAFISCCLMVLTIMRRRRGA